MANSPLSTGRKLIAVRVGHMPSYASGCDDTDTVSSPIRTQSPSLPRLLDSRMAHFSHYFTTSGRATATIRQVSSTSSNAIPLPPFHVIIAGWLFFL
jgi:hypothetical protein